MPPEADHEDVFKAELKKVGIPEMYWDRCIEAFIDIATLEEDGMRSVPPDHSPGAPIPHRPNI